MQRMGSVHILCVNVNVTIDTMLNFDANTDTMIDVDAKCEQTLMYSGGTRMYEQRVGKDAAPFYDRKNKNAFQ